MLISFSLGRSREALAATAVALLAECVVAAVENRRRQARPWAVIKSCYQ
jgi:hypothetical protein